MSVIMIDPERITERIFGGPHFGKFEIEDGLIVHPSGERYQLGEVDTAWYESRRARPTQTAIRQGEQV